MFVVAVGWSIELEPGEGLGHQEIRQRSAKAGAQKAPHALEDSPP
jgi:hypothetical protein